MFFKVIFKLLLLQGQGQKNKKGRITNGAEREDIKVMQSTYDKLEDGVVICN